jgi:hypothetical protein
MKRSKTYIFIEIMILHSNMKLVPRPRIILPRIVHSFAQAWTTLDHVFSKLKIPFEKVGFTLGGMWLGPILEIARMRSTYSGLMTQNLGLDS